MNDIRKYLSHAKIEDKNKNKIGRLKDLKDTKKQLFKETLNLLKIIKFDLTKVLDKSENTPPPFPDFLF